MTLKKISRWKKRRRRTNIFIFAAAYGGGGLPRSNGWPAKAEQAFSFLAPWCPRVGVCRAHLSEGVKVKLVAKQAAATVTTTAAEADFRKLGGPSGGARESQPRRESGENKCSSGVGREKEKGEGRRREKRPRPSEAETSPSN